MKNIDRETTVIAKANTSTTSNSFDEVLTVLNNPDALSMLGIMVFLLLVSLFIGKKPNRITSTPRRKLTDYCCGRISN